MPRILVLHGPNLNALGAREPDQYGSMTLDQLHRSLEDLAKELGCELETLQSNAEGVLIDALYGAVGRVDGVLLNPGGLTHTSVALRDAVSAVPLPVVEVHLTQPQSREPFRRHSLVSEVAVGLVQGFGADSYRLGLRALAARIAHGRQT
jgi:3-dehydroquinate dehydratase-2